MKPVRQRKTLRATAQPTAGAEPSTPDVASLLADLGIENNFERGDLKIFSPIDGAELGRVASSSAAEIEAAIARAVQAFKTWRMVPAPRRGELVRHFANQLRQHKTTLGTLVSLETGKILQEGLGEVQEMIDICDFAVGLSRQLYGLTMTSERPEHRMSETWHPLGPVVVISAFNFPVAVWAWNAAIAWVCGDPVIWKPSQKTPLTAQACQHLVSLAMAAAAPELGPPLPGLSELIVGNAKAGGQLAADHRIPLVSATGSTAMGREIAPVVARRFGRSILELGGNNAVILCPSANLEMALRGVLFGAVGTAGQRCTSTRRLFVQEAVYRKFLKSLKQAWAGLPIGNPLHKGTLVGPLIDGGAYQSMQAALEQARGLGARITGGERVLQDSYPKAWYVRPALVEMPSLANNVQTETFAPILYLYRYRHFDQALTAHNDVPQGLSSAIFTTDLREAEGFLSPAGSDCGIANVNIGTSGAEIGGAFGGEKETGGGREAGSDAWKAYMRRATNTINYSSHLPLAQGIRFDL